MLTVFEKTRPVVCAEELDDRLGIRRIVLRPALESLKGRLDARLAEYEGSIFAVLVEVRIENALIHHVFLTIDLKDQPSQVMRLKHLEKVGVGCDSFLDNFGVVVEVFFPSRNDLR